MLHRDRAKGKQNPAGQAWAARAEELAAWAWVRLVNRTDVWGGYWPLAKRGKEYTKPDGSKGVLGKTTTRPPPSQRGRVLLTEGHLIRHFRASGPGDVVGLHTTSPQNTCKWGTIEVDWHGEGSTPPATNTAAVLGWYGELVARGFRPLLTDSNDEGGYHLDVLFAEPVDSWRVFFFLRELVKDHTARGLPARPECFPKQPQLQADEKGRQRYGNWVRVVGRHHSSEHWSKAWDGTRWLEGHPAIDFILARQGDSPGLIPEDVEVRHRVGEYMATLPNLGEGQGRDDVAYNFAAFLVRDMKLGDAEALAWLECWDARNTPPKGADRLREVLGNAHLYGQRGYGSARNGDGDGGGAAAGNGVPPGGTAGPGAQRPAGREIVVNGRQLPEVTADAMAAVVAANDPPRLFQRGGLFARVKVDASTGAPSLQVLDEDATRGHLARVGRWVTEKEKSGGVVTLDVFPPLDVVRDVLSLPAWDGVPPLDALVETPVFARDGSLVAEEGYHPRARLWYRAAPGLKVPAVPAQPSRADIDQARALLLVELYGDFPFVEEASRAHALAALLLPFVRQTIDGPTPLHLFDAPVEGTGKTLLTSAVARVATGRDAEATSEATDDAEWRKRLTALLAEAPVFAFLDNLNRVLDSSALASALTTRFWKDRVLGVSKMATLPNTAVWIASGNNTRLSRELIRRTVWCRVDARTDAPWERTGWRHPNLLTWVGENRGALVWAALTLCQAWVAAGRPKGTQTLGMFESWVETMGGILDVAGVPGLLANAKQFRSTSADKVSEWRAFVAAWWQAYTTEVVGAHDLFKLAIDQKLLDSVLGDKGERSQRTRFGLALGKMRERVFGEYRVSWCQEDKRSQRQLYRLEFLGQAAPPEPPPVDDDVFEVPA